METHFVLLYVALLMSAAYAAIPKGFDTKQCTPPQATGGKDFPTIPNDYLARLEWNDHLNRKSLYMREYISGTNNIGATYITGFISPGVTTKYITSANTKELFIIYDTGHMEFQDGNCVVKPLDSNEEFALPFKGDPKYPESDKLLSGKSLLTLGANPVGIMTYSGTEKMNGIDCNVWVGCLFIPNGQITINVTYHFSAENWNSAGGGSTAPVGIRARGSSFEDPSYQLEQTFNYVYFSTQFSSLNPKYFAHVFETPEHAYCPGRVNVYRVPDVPTQFSFRAEVIDNLASTIMYTEEFYDFNAKYSRMDFKTSPTGNDSVDAKVSPSILINDFNTGVTYLIDKFSRACTPLPIISGEFDSVVLGNGMTRMRSPDQFFDFDLGGKYPWQYMGEHQVRNVPCDSWISYRPFPNDKSTTNATWEWFFTTKATIIKAEDLVEDLEPMRVVIKSTEANVDVTYNIFKFSENSPDPSAFDVRTCFADAGSRSFDLQLTGNWTEYNAENNIQLLRYWFQLAVEAFTGLRPIRVQDVEFVFYGKNIGVRFTMLGPAPIKGDVNNTVKQVSLQKASDRFSESFTDGIFQVYFMPNPSTTTVFSPVPKTLRAIVRKDVPGSAYVPPHTGPVRPHTQPVRPHTEPVSPHTAPVSPHTKRPHTEPVSPHTKRPHTEPVSPHTKRPHTKPVRIIVNKKYVASKIIHRGGGMTSGQAAGLAFGVMFLGALLAVVGVLVFKRMTSKNPTSAYFKQHNDDD